MRVLALDVGEKRIGVALSDPDGILASPHSTITSTSEADDIDAVLRLAVGNGAEEIVVGLPVSLSGKIGPQARVVRRFAEILSGRASVPVTTVDERYSTVEAERLIREAGGQPSRDRGSVDAAAAAVVLQSYLDSRKSSPPDPPDI